MTIQGIIFDMDGLLFDTEKVYCQANITVANQMGIPYSEEYYINHIGISDKELHEIYYQDFSEFSKEEIESFIQSGYKEIERIFLTDGVPLKKGAKELLEYSQANKIQCVIASSNFRSLIEALLDHADISSYFTGIVSFEDVSRAKPDPEIVLKAVDLLKLPKENIIMLEDSMNGINASYSAGVPVIMIPDLVPATQEAKEKSTYIYDDLSNVTNLIISEKLT